MTELEETRKLIDAIDKDLCHWLDFRLSLAEKVRTLKTMVEDTRREEEILKKNIMEHLAKLPEDTKLMFKVTIPTIPDTYAELIADPRVVRVVALSGGYTREDSNKKLAENHGLIASFSRALSEGLNAKQTAAEFDAMLKASVDSIYEASIT